MTFGPQMKSPRVINNQVKESGKKLPSTPHLLGPHEIHLKCVNASDYDLNYVQRLLPSALRSFFIVKLEAVEERPSHQVSNSIWEKKTFSYFIAGSGRGAAGEGRCVVLLC